MKKLPALLTLLAFAILPFSVSAAEEEKTELGKQMTSMNKSLRTLKRQLPDPAKKQENLDLVKKINETVVEACKFEPKKTADIPAGEKAAYKIKYKEQMDGLSASFAKLGEAIKADNQDEAKKILDELSKQKETGHKDFGVDD